MQVFVGIAYFVVGFVQLFAISAGLESWWHVNSFLGFILALFVTYIPLVGSAIGVYGATSVWGWGLAQAVVLFFWYVPVFIGLWFLDRAAGR